MPLFTVLSVFLVMTIGTFFIADLANVRRARVSARLANVRLQTVMQRDVELEKPFSSRVVMPLVALAARWGNVLTPHGQRARLVAKLQAAGHHGVSAIHVTLAVKGLALLGALGGAWLIAAKSGPAGVLVGGVGAAIALVAPELVINRLVADRQLSLVKSLPDTLDLITASVEAGLTMDGAMARIVSRPSRGQTALAEELGRYLQEIRLGTSRAEALEALGRRCGVADLQSVVAALLQADSLGVGIGTVLRALSLHLRTRRKQRAQEAAMKAPVKMLFPLVLFIFPSIFIVTLGPAVIRIIDTFASK
jgi:tight adherence protein C